MAPKPSKRKSSRKGGKGKKTVTQTPQEKPDHPDDIAPLVLTSATQELFECRADEDVTAGNPHKLLRKDLILQDIKTRAAVSDFSPVKKFVLDYPEEELLLVFDKNFTYGQVFYLVLTPEAKNRIFSPPDPETTEEEESDRELDKTPEPKPWKSLGSEREIEEESVKETKHSQFKILQRGKEPRAPFHFSDANSYFEIPSYEDSKFTIRRMLLDCGTQAVSVLKSSSCQTERKLKRNVTIQYEPRELSEEERERILHSEGLKSFCQSVLPRMQRALQQLEITDVLADSLAEEASNFSSSASLDLKLSEIFSLPKCTDHRTISCVKWHPTINSMLAVSLMAKQRWLPDESTRSKFIPYIVFFDRFQTSEPLLLLESPEDVYVFDFCPSDPNIIAAGCENGMVVLWNISFEADLLQKKKESDLRGNTKSPAPVLYNCVASPFDAGHREPITDLQWLPPTLQVSESGSTVENKDMASCQLVTCSPDCTVIFWDVKMSLLLDLPRNPTGLDYLYKNIFRTCIPLFKVFLPNVNEGRHYTPVKFCLEKDSSIVKTLGEKSDSDVVPGAAGKLLTRIYLGTTQGEVVSFDWATGLEDVGSKCNANLTVCRDRKVSAVWTMERSPFFPDVILATGGFTFSLWKDGVPMGPIVVSPWAEELYTTGCWSPCRPSVLFLGRDDGSVEVWDLMVCTGKAVKVLPAIANGSITCIQARTCSPKQYVLAISDNLGGICVWEITKTHHTPSQYEIEEVRALLKNQVNILHYYLKQEELLDAQIRDEEEQKRKAAQKAEVVKVDWEEEDRIDRENYRQLEEQVLKKSQPLERDD